MRSRPSARVAVVVLATLAARRADPGRAEPSGRASPGHPSITEPLAPRTATREMKAIVGEMRGVAHRETTLNRIRMPFVRQG